MAPLSLTLQFQNFFPPMKYFTWNFQEAGHGKGAPDGIGGVLKKTADRLVGEGKDLASLSTLVEKLSINCPGINSVVTKEEIEAIEFLVSSKIVPTFKGTMKIHQVLGRRGSSPLQFRKLSCFKCPYSRKCESFGIGVMKYSDMDESNIKNDASTSHSLSYFNFRPTDICPETFVFVKFDVGKKDTEYRYAAVCQSGVEDENDVKVQFMNIVDDDASLFKINDTDVSYIDFTQILQILPNPNLKLKGHRMMYHFPYAIDVFEKW